MGQYDIALKSMFHSGGRGVLRALGIEGPLQRLDSELPSARERRIDFLAQWRPHGLLHIEFQTRKAPRFALRMLGYYVEILERFAAGTRAAASRPPAAMEIRQILIYLGADRWTAPATLRHTNLTFRFDVLNVIDLDAGPLIETGDLGDAVFALLCHDGTSPAMLRAILARIAEAPLDQRSDALAQLLVMSTLRKARDRLMEVQNAMPITVNVADIPLLREPIDRAFAEGKTEGKAEGEAAGLVKGKAEGKVEGLAEAVRLMLAEKFGPLPPDLATRLMALRPEDLIVMISRIHAATSLNAVLDHVVPRARKARR